MNKKDRILVSFVYVFCALFSVSIILPFINIIAISFSGSRAVASGKVTFWPVDFSWAPYERVITAQYFFSAYQNTLIVVVCGTLLSMVLTVLAAFPISRSDLPGKGLISFLITLTMWFAGGMIPTFLVVRQLGLYDSLLALFVPSAVSAYNVIIVRNFFMNVPDSLEESAVLDGANDLQTLFRIYLPLSTSVLATVALWLAVGYWNEFTSAVLYLSTRSKYTLQVVLRELILQNAMKEIMGGAPGGEELGVVEKSLKYANIILTILPILCLYPFLQRYFVKGVLIGAVKG